MHRTPAFRMATAPGRSARLRPRADSNDAAAGDVVISEIMYHPYHPPLTPEDTRREWIELFNRGSRARSLAGWRLADAVDFVFPEVVLEAGERLVVAADASVFRSRHPDVHECGGRLDRMAEQFRRETDARPTPPER